MKRLYSTKRNRPTNRKRSKSLARQRLFMLKNIKIAGTKLKLLAFNYVLLPWPSLTYITLLCSLHAHKASSLWEFFANKYATIQRLLLQSFAVSRSSKFSLWEFFVCKYATRVEYYEAALRFYLSLLSASFTLCKCLQKNKRPKRIIKRPNFGSRPMD